jgi:hypothetical protein
MFRTPLVIGTRNVLAFDSLAIFRIVRKMPAEVMAILSRRDANLMRIRVSRMLSIIRLRAAAALSARFPREKVGGSGVIRLRLSDELYDTFIGAYRCLWHLRARASSFPHSRSISRSLKQAFTS